MSGKDLHEFTLQLHRETAQAVFVSDDGQVKRAVWIPRSQCASIDERPCGIVVIEIPEWLAKDKGIL